MRALWLSSVGVLFGATAIAAPIDLSHSGRLLDGDGEPFNGAVDLEVNVFTQGASTPVHPNEFDGYVLSDGYYTVFLSVDTDTFLSPTEIQVRVNNQDIGGRQPLVRTANAAVADVAARVPVTANSPSGDCGEEGAITWSRADSSLFVCDDAGEWQAAGSGSGDGSVGDGSVEPGNVNLAASGETLWTVPDGVTTVFVRAWGGGGAGGNQTGATGGGGAYIEASIGVTPGEELQLQVAEGGDVLGSGGGASLILRGGTPLVVAAGGGGGASDGASGSIYVGGAGGAGGGLTGESGTDVQNPQYSCSLATGGSGGTQNGGGAGGTFVRSSGTNSADCSGADGSYLASARCSGIAASGYSNGSSAGNGYGPSGGSGYYGGGGGGGVATYCAAGGGGGSSYAEPTATSVVMQGGSGRSPGEPTTGAGGLRVDGSFGSQHRGQDGRIELSWGG